MKHEKKKNAWSKHKSWARQVLDALSLSRLACMQKSVCTKANDKTDQTGGNVFLTSQERWEKRQSRRHSSTTTKWILWKVWSFMAKHAKYMTQKTSPSSSPSLSPATGTHTKRERKWEVSSAMHILRSTCIRYPLGHTWKEHNLL